MGQVGSSTNDMHGGKGSERSGSRSRQGASDPVEAGLNAKPLGDPADVSAHQAEGGVTCDRA